MKKRMELSVPDSDLRQHEDRSERVRYSGYTCLSQMRIRIHFLIIFVRYSCLLLQLFIIHLFGTAYGFLRSCQMGMIGVSALEPKGLKEYMMKGKIPVYDAENEEKRINFYTYIIWILAV